MPEILGIHHLKIAVADLDRSLDFYERVFGAVRIPEADHRRTSDNFLYAYILNVPSWGTMLELRLDAECAERHRGFNPITLTVEGRDALNEWIDHLDAAGIDHSSIITGVRGWLLAFADPDGQQLRFYTRETHGPEYPPDEANPWITG